MLYLIIWLQQPLLINWIIVRYTNTHTYTNSLTLLYIHVALICKFITTFLIFQDGHEICFVGDEAFKELSQVDPKGGALLQDVSWYLRTDWIN